MEKKRSKGLTTLGRFFLFCVILGIMFAFIGLISGPSGPQDALGGTLSDLIRIGFILSPFIFLIEGIGILKLKNWARIFTITFCLINTLLVVIYFIHFHIVLKMPLDILNDLIWLSIGVFSLYVIYYLTRSKVKEQFK